MRERAPPTRTHTRECCARVMKKKLLVNENSEKEEDERSPASRVSVDDILGFIGFGPFQMVAFLLAGIASFSYSIDAALFAFIAQPIQEEWKLSPIHFAILPSVTGIANIIGGFVYGYLSDAYGRVWPFALCSFNIAVVGLASAFSPNFYVFVGLRFVTSLGITACLALLYPVLVEFLPIRNRGKATVAIYLVQAVTTCMTGGLAWWLIPNYTKYGWRYLTIATSAPAFITAIYRLVFYVESPRFLISKGKYAAARKILTRMAKWNRKDLDQYLPSEIEFTQLVETETAESSTTQTLRNFLSMFRPYYLRNTIALLIISTTNAGTFWGISLFLPSLLYKITPNSYFIAFMGYLGQIPGILLMLIIVEWPGVGRLNSLRFYSLLAIVFLLLFGLYQNEAATPIFTIMIYFSMVPLSALLMTYSSESYPTSTRALALNLFNNIGAFVNIFTPYIGGYSTELFSHRPWLFSVIWCFLYFIQLLTTFLLTREPLGRSLQDNS